MSREKSGGLSVATLLIASGSAAAAAIIVPLLWDGGGVVAAAITPVIVTLVSESLRHPVSKVQEVGVWRRTPQGTAVRQPSGRDFDPLDPEEERIEIVPEHPEDPFGLREPERGGFFTKRKVAIALITGALAFGIAAVVVTAGELTLGGSAATEQSRTTFFGGTKRKSDATPTATPTATQAEGATPTPSADRDRDPVRGAQGPGHRHAVGDAGGHAERSAADAGHAGAHSVAARATALPCPERMAKDRIPTSRISRTARVTGLAAGQAARQLGTATTNLARTEEGREKALERRHIEAAEQIVSALGTMKGAAMKLGQVMSFLDVGLVPGGVSRGVPAQAGGAA